MSYNRLGRRPPIDPVALASSRNVRPARVRVTEGLNLAVRPAWRAALMFARTPENTRRHRKARAKLRRLL